MREDSWQKSSFSGNGPGNECVEVAVFRSAWQKSSFSGPGPDNACVELAAFHSALGLRESDDPGTVIITTPAALAALLRAAKAHRITARL
ncbi:DUF397 domain-containing protein [Streptomyces sp. NPDC026206]|uniref:DUF397 domain-containing protein n=1 Tax=Streptomyces sp. NPDC026206 TaxID=3157089 RepID=UPI003402F8E8